MKLINKLFLFFYNPIIRAEYIPNTLIITYRNGKSVEYKGSCTVWYNGLHRCSSVKEYELTEYWNYCKNGKIYLK